MFKLAKPLFIHAVTPIHVGCGSDLGVVDLPIQRERHTSFPKIEASSLKGAIREAFEERMGEKEIDILFGPEDAGNEGFAGAMGFSDARILLFPVKSVKGVFAWITCPYVLRRFKEDLELCRGNDGLLQALKNIKENTISSGNILINEKVILEEYAFSVSNNNSTRNIANKISEVLGIPDIADKMVILKDDDFRDLVNLSTEVITRIKIDNETGTVQTGALFTEELLPAETVMYSIVFSSKAFLSKDKRKEYSSVEFLKEDDEENSIMSFFAKTIEDLKVIQIGGDATLGKGIVNVKI